jgi:hypothetical protein
MRRFLAVPVVLAGILVLAACGTKTIDHESLQDDIQSQLAQGAGVDAKEIKVACPEDQEAKKDTSFDCEITAPNGEKGTMTVTLTNDDGGYTATEFKSNAK